MDHQQFLPRVRLRREVGRPGDDDGGIGGVHGIGGREDPVRLVFTADPGPAVVAALSDMRDRRVTVNASPSYHRRRTYRTCPSAAPSGNPNPTSPPAQPRGSPPAAPTTLW